ncbi:glycosyl hydrolase family 18 protein [Priestia filamentosa]|uniref:glycosyl hydrolase family 18 protein n=1 Tax=Priestia filamentosa TaxID=1402861 RepID=UPI002E210441|nr:glycosyl hydrolase family 18 protein [Priestia filamentosa]MED3726342.1 glycosyl hydrolase family 18 protein [Priestia filamentosa]
MQKIKVYLLLIVIAVGAFIFYEVSAAPSEEEDKKFIMSYLYEGDTSDYLQNVKRTQGALNEVSPAYFNLNDDGTLQETKSINSSFIEEMHEQSVAVVPFLSDHWDEDKAKAALENKEELTSQIASTIEQYNLDGINVDIENVTAEEREDYSEFVKLLKEKLPDEKTVSVAVAANPNGWNTGWQGAYDYSTLAQYSDYLMLMAYDEHSVDHETSGPVASFSFVEKTIKYALSQNVPSEKIVLGIPFYGRLWNDDGTILGIDIPMKNVDALIERYDGEIVYDEEYQSVKATFTVKSTDEPSTINGTKLTPGTYTLWYENEQSIKAKLQLIQKYNLKGAGIWNLGKETAQTWDYFEQSLNVSSEK